MQLWQIHVAEQMILDDLEMNPEKYKDKELFELVDDNDFDEENGVEYTKAYYKNTLLPKMVLVRFNMWTPSVCTGFCLILLVLSCGRKPVLKNSTWRLR